MRGPWLRVLRDEGPSRTNQVWQLDFTELATSSGGTWRLAGCRDHYSNYELGGQVSPTANQHDAIAARFALSAYPASGSCGTLRAGVTRAAHGWMVGVRCGTSVLGGAPRRPPSGRRGGSRCRGDPPLTVRSAGT